jgi:TRAP-type C4-dicarboxylate transport system permease large subunit
MIVGLVLIVLSVAAAVAAVAFNNAGPTHEITAFGQHVTNANDTQIFIGGIVIGLVFCIGVWMVSVAGKRRRALRAEYRAARREAADAGRERDRLAEQLSTQQEITQREQDTTVIGRHRDREVTS